MIRELPAAGLLATTLLLVSFAGTARADSSCQIPDTAVLDIIPAGCDAILTNGPIHYNGVLGGNGDTNNIEIDTMEIFNMNSSNTAASNAGVMVFLQGILTDVTTGMSMGVVGIGGTSFFQTSPAQTAYSAGTGTQNFTLTHFIDPVGGGGALKLNLGDNNSGAAAETSTISSSATDSGGMYTVTTSITMFTEFTGGPNGYTVATNDFSGTTPSTGSVFALETFNPSSNPTLYALLYPTPEPETYMLFGLGLAAILAFKRTSSR